MSTSPVKNVFENFTNLYSLSKTLKFELRPIGNTQKILEEEKISEQDRIRREKYLQTKPFFDTLNREFINECLKDKEISNLEKYYAALERLQKNPKDKQVKKDFKKISQELRTELNSHFKANALFATIFSEEVFDELKKRYGAQDDAFLKDESGNFVLDDKKRKISLFDDWKNFTGYFIKFQETRKNFYKDDGTSTAVATRIIDQNLKRFCENLQLFTLIKNKINFEEAESNFSVKLDKIFSLNYYNSCLLQSGIDAYNRILGGEVKTNGEKIKGLNEIINKYRQDSGQKIDFFKLLDKQILSEKEEFFETIKNDDDLLDYLKDFLASAEEKIGYLKKLLDNFFENPGQYDLDKIYLSKEALNTILYKWMSDEGRSEFQKASFEQYKKDKTVTFDKDNSTYKFPDFVPLSLINNVLEEDLNSDLWKEKYLSDNTGGRIRKDGSKFDQFIDIFKYEFDSLFDHKRVETVEGGEREIRSGYDIYRTAFEKIVDKNTASFSVSSDEKLAIKNFVDNTLWIYQMGKYFALEKKRGWIDEYEIDSDFYYHADYGLKNKFYDNAFDKIVKQRMLIQSYLTKKPFNTEKWKLNFENPTLADGFDKNKEADNTAVILRKDGRYYLAIMKKNCNKIFDDRNRDKFTAKVNEDCYEKMVYKLLPGANKMLPKVFFSKKNIGYFQPSEEIMAIRNHASHTKSGEPQKGFEKKEFNIDDCHKIIDFFKQSIEKHEDWKQFGFQFSPTARYKDTSDFFREVEDQGYQVKFEAVSESYIQEKNNNGELFLFKIHNKDWNLKDGKRKEGNKNLHTMYFEELFSEENMRNDFVFKLNGQAELFFRPETPPVKLGKKRDKSNKDVINHKRYAENKYFFHVPITINRTAREEKRFNQKTNEFLADNPDINIIGIDRGEKHLIYYAGIDQKGNLLKDKDKKPVLGSLNIINGIDYSNLLEERAKTREKERQDWQDIEGIKDLKKGYISLVARKLADLMIEHNAIIILEDLSMRFKQVRGGIEKSVYQQLEKALINKLNFLVNKNEMDPQKAGSLLRAYQLTAPFTSFKDMGKQTGTIFYTQASYTSKTCPVCGFRPNVNWSNEDAIQKINISYQDNGFVIFYHLSDLIKDKKNKSKSKRGNILYQDKKAKDLFVIKTHGAVRYKWFLRNKPAAEMLSGIEKMPGGTQTGITLKYDITECLKNLFKKEGIDYTKDIKSEMNNNARTKKFYKDLSFLLYLLSNTRSTISGQDVDIINCPCCNFDSDKGFQECDFNGDANGAYNIARKGIMILEKINQFKRENGSLEKMTWGDLFIDIEEWDKFTQNPEYVDSKIAPVKTTPVSMANA